MRFATVLIGDRTRGAIVEGGTVFPVDAVDALDAYTRRASLRRSGPLDAASTHFAAVVPAPAHILCVGLNDRAHIKELGRPVPEYPTMFAKFASTLTGPRDGIRLPDISDHVDEEVELAVIIGHRVRRGSVDQARAAIAGYTVSNDMSLRDWQHRTSEALQGKVFDRSTPLGPCLVTPDEVDHGRALRMTAMVDAAVWQDGSTEDLVFSPAQLVSYCSQFMTMERGDVILTGTPGKKPGATGRLRAGSRLTSTIEGLGSCINPLLPDDATGLEPTTPGALSRR